MVIRTVIIEDEEKSLCVLSELIRQFAGDLEICGSAGYVDKAVQLIETKAPQLVFLDVRIADGTGFDVLRKLPSRDFELVFVTAYDNYAVEAFRFSAVDYLLKPIGIPEFEEAVDRVRKKATEKNRHGNIDTLLFNLARQSGQDRKVSIPTLHGCEFADLKDILWCSSKGSYTIFHLTNKTKIISSRNLGFYEELLSGNRFFRIHHKAIINMQFVKSYVKGKSGVVILTDGTELKISQRKKMDFLKECSF
jgi:two-component system LytT family response regulator